MPLKDPLSDGQQQPGSARMLDVQFRHFRYDNLEPVVDACYHAIQQLSYSSSSFLSPDYEARNRTPLGTQYSLFHDVQFEDARFERDGINLRLSFACPERLRRRKMLSSGHFESGMLVALIGLDWQQTLLTTFCKVELCQSTFSMQSKTGSHLRSAIVVSFADPSDSNTVRQTLYSLKHLRLQEKLILVEFPKVLVPGFIFILKHLQLLAETQAQIAFSDSINRSAGQNDPKLAPPAYSDSSEFSYDLGILRNDDQPGNLSPLRLQPQRFLDDSTEQNRIVDALGKSTTLDKGQATALCESLSRELAFTQGPPGTGKTFLGVALSKVILHQVPGKPILVACMTNHALDNFLADLYKQGITKLARIGANSKEGWIDRFTLPSLRKGFNKSSKEAALIGRAMDKVECLSTHGRGWCEAFNSGNLTWAAVQEHLRSKYKDAFESFSKVEPIRPRKASDLRSVRNGHGGFAFAYWCDGGDLEDIRGLARFFRYFIGETESLSADESSSSGASSSPIPPYQFPLPSSHTSKDSTNDVWSLTMQSREDLIAKWKGEISIFDSADKLAEVHQRYLKAQKEKKEVHEAVDARCLADQQVIGLTTTACAKYWSMLKSLELQTLICEEAGEIIEAQTLTTLLPTIKHGIFIGDPLQLRPQINQPSLSMENTEGMKYRLDESLFERLVMPSIGSVNPFPASKLNLQRRMHPDVADLMRETLYPYLEDHPSTARLPVAGMVDRTFWLDHREPEDAPDPFAVGGRSYSNAFECNIICGLVRYLLNT